jgi:glycerol kinase
LLLDPYFSATKIKWILEHVEGARAKAEAGELAFGTIDSFLIWKLTRGKHHVTDATNASRTMLYDIGKGEWSTELCRLFEIPMALLPSVQDCASHFGETHPEIFGSPISICAVAGDQQAATLGQACFKPGMLKATFGTGCFALLNTGSEKVQSKNRLLTTIAYQFDGKVTYALEGSIFIAGAVVQWLRDGLKIIHHAGETANLADAADASQNVIIVPAFTGLGAPYWNAHCRGAIFGLTRNSGPAEFARAALQSVGFQTRDLWQAMRVDWHVESQTTLRVDGGMSASDYTMQFLSDILNVPVDRPPILETTALGVAWAAGHRAGVLDGMEAFAKHWQVEKSFSPQMNDEAREAKYQSWKRAITSTLQF